MDAGPRYRAATSDSAIDTLLAEHRTILGVVDEVERECRRVEGGSPLREPFWRDVLRFHDEFDHGLHHQKEETLLFPALEQAGLPAEQGPTAVLRDEHRRTHFCRTRLEQALGARDRARLAAAATSYIELLRAHVLKENQILFPLCRQLLSSATLEALQRQFQPLAADRRVQAWLHHPFAITPEA
jgi:hemerythrin-like domain-containing protein